jgi:ribosomal protein L37AE/L43A
MPDHEELIPEADLKRRWNRCHATIWRCRKCPDFPRPAAIINGRRLYRLVDIREFETRDLADAA